MSKFLNMEGLSYFWSQIKAKLNNKVDKVDGKGLSTNDYTNEEKAKLAGLSNYNHPTSGVSAGSYTKVTVDANGHVTEGSNPTTLAGYGITDGASKVHTHNSDDIVSLDASKLTGTIDIERLPAGALERLVIVANDAERFSLTTANVQKGDTVKVVETGLMYFVVDDAKLAEEAGYESYTAGTATSVPWSGVTGKPETFKPTQHNHTVSEIDDFPTAMKNPNAITISVNGVQTVYDGDSAKTITINEETLGFNAITTGEIDSILAN